MRPAFNAFSFWKATHDEWLQVLMANGAKIVSERELERCSAWDLDVRRNEIYARHGYVFSRQDLAAHFEKQDWYTGVSSDKWLVESQLTEEEKATVRFIIGYAGNRRCPGQPNRYVTA